MIVAFRVDSSYEIGVGHITRCLNLGREFFRKGHSVIFVGRGIQEHVLGGDFKVCDLGSCQTDRTLDPSSWLGSSWEADALRCCEILQDLTVDLLIVDHYTIDERWERQVQAALKCKIFVIDDLADRPHFCSFLLDQTNRKDQDAYMGLVNKDCILFLGLKYSLLNPEFSKCKARRNKASDKAVQKVGSLLISFGGSDVLNASSACLKALFALKRMGALSALKNVDVVIGALYSKREDLLLLAKSKESPVTVHVHCSISQAELAELLLQSDACIGGAGCSAYERCCVGVPSAIITVAENQIPNASTLQELGCAQWLGTCDILAKPDLLAEKMEEFCTNCSKLQELRDNGLKHFDGNGITRVVEEMSLILQKTNAKTQ